MKLLETNDFNKLLKKYDINIKNIIKKYLFAATKKGIEFNDLYQESLIVLYNSIYSFKEDLSKYNTYLNSLLENRFRDLIRKENKYSSIILNDSISLDDTRLYDIVSSNTYLPEDEMITNETEKMIKGLLSEVEYKVFELRREGKSYKDISFILDLPIKSVENSFMRIRKKIKGL